MPEAIYLFVKLNLIFLTYLFLFYFISAHLLLTPFAALFLEFFYLLLKHHYLLEELSLLYSGVAVHDHSLFSLFIRLFIILFVS